MQDKPNIMNERARAEVVQEADERVATYVQALGANAKRRTIV